MLPLTVKIIHVAEEKEAENPKELVSIENTLEAK